VEATARDDVAVLLAERDRLVDARRDGVVDDGAEVRLTVDGVTDDELLRALLELGDELVGDGCVDDDAAARAALLPGEAEGRAHDALSGGIKVCGCCDDGRVLTAHLCEHGALVAAGAGGVEELPSDLRGTGE